jgi:hypothetical protein
MPADDQYAGLRVLQCALVCGDVILTMPRPSRHHTLMHEAHDRFGNGHHESGFLLSDGSYAGRKRAYAVAFVAGQILPRQPGQYNGPDLYSEDLW